MKIAIGNDHAGVEIKEKIKDHLTKKGHTVINKGYDGNCLLYTSDAADD